MISTQTIVTVVELRGHENGIRDERRRKKGERIKKEIKFYLPKGHTKFIAIPKYVFHLPETLSMAQTKQTVWTPIAAMPMQKIKICCYHRP